MKTTVKQLKNKTKDLNSVLKSANESFDKRLKEQPELTSQRDRNSYILGWLQSEYKQVFNDINSI